MAQQMPLQQQGEIQDDLDQMEPENKGNCNSKELVKQTRLNVENLS